MGPADSRRIPRVPRYSGAASAPLRVSPTGLSPPMVTLSCVFGYPSRRLCRRSYNPGRGLDRPGLGSCAFARHYWRNHCYFLFLRVLRCFSSPRSLHTTRCGDGIATAGFPHSDIRGSRSICLSPRLFAAYHVLRRLREPQASPVRPFLLSCIFRLYDLATSGSLDSRYF